MGGLCTLPADAALPGQRAAWRGRGGLVGVVELRTLEVQNDLGHRTTQGQCAHVDTCNHPITISRSSVLLNSPNHNLIITATLVVAARLAHTPATVIFSGQHRKWNQPERLPVHSTVGVYWAQRSGWSGLLGWSAGGSPPPACWSHGPAHTERRMWASGGEREPLDATSPTQDWPAQVSACSRSCSNALALRSELCTRLASPSPPGRRSARSRPEVHCPAGPELRPSLRRHAEEDEFKERWRNEQLPDIHAKKEEWKLKTRLTCYY